MDRIGAGRRSGGSDGDQFNAERINDLIAELVAYRCGSWREVKFGMGLSELAAMRRRWADHPPLEMMAAAYLGIKAKPRQTDKNADIEAALSFFGVPSTGGEGMIR